MRSMTTPPSKLRAATSKSFRKGSGNSSLLASRVRHLQKSEYRRPRGEYENLLRIRHSGIIAAADRSARAEPGDQIIIAGPGSPRVDSPPIQPYPDWISESILDSGFSAAC